ncbi:MAG TPA: GDSL-type esterase/lipase family protein [Verrucomicrobiae bacterium]|nr:GDSL-type esterase/lipase family protein [Verrucomicrobiae bacterium]
MNHRVNARMSCPLALLLAVWGPALTAGLETAARSKDLVAGGGPVPTVVCLGDSITHAGYPAILEKLLPVRAINAGVGGDTTRKALKRLEADVLARRPAAVVMFFGANDSRQDAPGSQVPLDEYEANLGELVQRCQKAGAKVLLGTMPPIDPEPYYKRHPREKYGPLGGLEKIVESYRMAALRVAKAKGAQPLDLNQLLGAKPEWMNPDGVHPSPRGKEIIAELVARELGPLLGATPKNRAVQ